VWIPSRVDVIDRLDREGLLPAIVFVFSRVGCDAAVAQCVRSGVRLTSTDERDEIFAFVEEACRHLPDEDLHVLGYHDFLDGLTRGLAAHHAGMLPAFKEWSRSSSYAACARSSSPPRPWPSASTCPPAPWSSRSWTSGTARRTPRSRRGSTPS
jgi:ATP-dependent RNA helicase HelY